MNLNSFRSMRDHIHPPRMSGPSCIVPSIEDFMGYVAEASKGWDEPKPREMERKRPQPSIRGGMYSLLEDLDTKDKLSTLARWLEELEMRNHHEV